MATKIYDWQGGLWRFKEGEQPAGAVEHKSAKKPAPKSRNTRNKARTAKNKEAAND